MTSRPIGFRWEFSIKDDACMNEFDLKRYQEEINKFKLDFSSHKNMVVEWSESPSQFEITNIFGKFLYGRTDPKMCWHLFWDPNMVAQEQHRCIMGLTLESSLWEFQKKLVKMFPGVFTHHRREGRSKYHPREDTGTVARASCDREAGRDDDTYDCQEEFTAYSGMYQTGSDFTACDKDECGYCGRCWY